MKKVHRRGWDPESTFGFDKMPLMGYLRLSQEVPTGWESTVVSRKLTREQQKKMLDFYYPLSDEEKHAFAKQFFAALSHGFRRAYFGASRHVLAERTASKVAVDLYSSGVSAFDTAGRVPIHLSIRLSKRKEYPNDVPQFHLTVRSEQFKAVFVLSYQGSWDEVDRLLREDICSVFLGSIDERRGIHLFVGKDRYLWLANKGVPLRALNRHLSTGKDLKTLAFAEEMFRKRERNPVL